MKKLGILFLALALMMSLFTACGKARESTDMALVEQMNGAAADGLYYKDYEASPEFAPEVQENASVSVATNRKLIRTVDLTAETEEYDTFISNVEAQIASSGGYLESFEADTRYSSNNRYASMKIRVPAAKLDSLISTLGEISNIVRRSESTEDITLAYVDTQSERDALKVEQERLLALLDKSESLKDILEIESRLTDVRYRLESIESQLRTYDNLVDYATVYLSVNEVTVLTPTGEKGFWQKIGEGFVQSLQSVWSGLKAVFSFVIVAIPYLLVIAAFVILLIVIIRFCTRKRRKSHEKKEN